MKKKRVSLCSQKQMDRYFKKLEKWEKAHPILTFIKRAYYRTKLFIEFTPLNIKCFIQRGKRGWSDRDVWGLDYYLANTIAKTTYNLKKFKNGCPIGLTEGKWTDILNIITETFELSMRCSDGDLYLIRNKRKRIGWQKGLDKVNEERDVNHKCMTEKEIQLYDKGWELFKKYFFSLWD